ncbi:hypothetical protein MmarC5_0246 [Methanococcus maripaludis C5]|uniref:Uncharacterized protein n=1 Tax=Methanococcus maripaludis (strain C5 / ATCC BAA-1333) TaxID=402880 RepID=A4FWI7_METM5|nr:hypothetical protein [Methanococcus maripaludis]ABO34562.1 hypothetical protein MmarC5_0246 [Methanococcus maripaludis C5]
MTLKRLDISIVPKIITIREIGEIELKDVQKFNITGERLNEETKKFVKCIVQHEEEFYQMLLPDHNFKFYEKIEVKRNLTGIEIKRLEKRVNEHENTGFIKNTSKC